MLSYTDDSLLGAWLDRFCKTFVAWFWLAPCVVAAAALCFYLLLVLVKLWHAVITAFYSSFEVLKVDELMFSRVSEYCDSLRRPVCCKDLCGLPLAHSL